MDALDKIMGYLLMGIAIFSIAIALGVWLLVGGNEKASKKSSKEKSILVNNGNGGGLIEIQNLPAKQNRELFRNPASSERNRNLDLNASTVVDTIDEINASLLKSLAIDETPKETTEHNNSSHNAASSDHSPCHDHAGHQPIHDFGGLGSHHGDCW